MTRTLTASIALAATLAMGGIAQAQMSPNQPYVNLPYETPGKPSGQQQAPSAFTSPAVPTNSSPYSQTYTLYPSPQPTPTH
jgi:hypothetical protein